MKFTIEFENKFVFIKVKGNYNPYEIIYFKSRLNQNLPALKMFLWDVSEINVHNININVLNETFRMLRYFYENGEKDAFVLKGEKSLDLARAFTKNNPLPSKLNMFLHKEDAEKWLLNS